ncbi:3-keto-5-aminohexanoate cleavage protein [Pseudomonas aeruginosa]|nr:3-keto-5-aminohexanoate cleavage protein [Pseudomonas aeruginosa]
MFHQKKIIISCAITGAIHTPSMSRHLPVTADEIAEASIAACEAGAAIIHLHARDPVTGKPDQRPQAFTPFLEQIKARSSAIVNLTTGGAPYMTVQERMQPAKVLKPEIASMNMGTMNFGLFPMLGRYKEFKHEWEKTYLEDSKDMIFRNTYGDLETVLTELAVNETRYEFECYDTSHLYNLAHFVERGLVKAPIFIQTVFGILGGIGTHPDDVMHMKRTADRLFGDTYRWSVLGAGASQMKIAAMAAAMGSNVRVGLEDNLWIAKGKLATSNAEQVLKVREILEGLGLEVATPDEAREILQTKGPDMVGF